MTPPRSFVRPLLAVALLGLTAAASTAPGARIQGRAWTLQSSGAPWSFAPSDDGGFRFEVRPGDEWARDAGRRPPRGRAEVRDTALLDWGKTYWFAFSARLEASGPLTSNNTIFAQIHASDDRTDVVPSGPIVDLRIDGQGHFAVRASVSPDDPTTQPAYAALYTDPAPFVFGRRDRYVMQVRTQADAQHGMVRVWRDGALVVDRPDLPLGYVNARPPYMKIGIYREQDDATVISQVSDLIGPTTDDLSGLVAPQR